MNSDNKTFEYFDYDPTRYSVDRKGVFSAFIVLLMCVVGIIALG
jgi:hypothetical protein